MNKSAKPKEMIVLVVEDDPILAELFAIAFQLSGFKPIITADGLAAIRLIKEMLPEVILLDLHLPKMMGDDVFQSLKNDPAMARAITILATGDSRRASYLQDQVEFVLLKPISFTQLRQLATRIYQAAKERAAFQPKSDTGPIDRSTGFLT